MPNYRNKNKNKRNKNRNKSHNQNKNHSHNEPDQSQNHNKNQNQQQKPVNVSKTQNVEQREQEQAAVIAASTADTQISADASLTAVADHVIGAEEKETIKQEAIQDDVPSSSSQSAEATSLVIDGNGQQEEANAAMGNNTSTATPKSDSIKPEQSDENGQACSTENTQKTQLGKVILHRIVREESPEEKAVHAAQEPIKHAQDNVQFGLEDNQDNVKVIIHRVTLEDHSESNAETAKQSYHVEHPETDEDSASQTAKCHRKQVQIQEISDEGSNADSTDNPPLVSEAESEPEPETAGRSYAYEHTAEDIVDIQSMPLEETIEELLKENIESRHAHSTVQESDVKQRRAQKRAALETHFLPQLLSPRYLDSIMEENSDMSDARSDCSDNTVARSLAEEDSHDSSQYESDPKVKRANAVFPRSNLDFSKKHKHGPLPKKSPLLPIAIREEPVAMVVETKLVESEAAEESCSRLSSALTPESEAAEVVYIDSASSSLSDLLELDSEGSDEDTYHSAIDLDTDVREIITKPPNAESNASNSRESTPVNQPSPPTVVDSSVNPANKNEATNDNKTQQSQNQNDSAEERNSQNDNENEQPENLQLLEKTNEHDAQSSNILSSGNTSSSVPQTTATITTTSAITKIETTTPTAADSELCEDWQSFDTASSSEAKNSTASASNSLRAEHIAEPVVLLQNIEMNSVREIISSNTSDTSATNRPSSASNAASVFTSDLRDKPSDPLTLPDAPHDIPPPVPPPPSDISCELGEQLQYSPVSYPNRISVPTEQKIYQHQQQQEELQKQTQLPQFTSSALLRQESADSHCSDSTNHSQCTAINVGSGSSAPNYSDLTSSISDDNTLWKSASTEHSDAPDAAVDNQSSSGEYSDAAIKKLRLLCTETLASMPYGEQVLEELATVAQDISTQGKANMPYPLPDLPHINDLQLSIADNGEKLASPRTVTIKQTINTTTSAIPNPHDQLNSPPPPPVPAPPTNYDAWLGLPTSADPKLLVCLSPAQRSCLQEQHKSPAEGNADQLLDAHQKFLERRGYHEYTDEQVKAINAEKLEEQQILKTAAIMKKLRKSLTPPPPVPPPPVPHKSAETAAKAQSQAAKAAADNDVSTTNANEQQPEYFADGEENSHRLLTIIHDTDVQALKQQQQQEPNQMPKTSSFENNSRRATDKQGEALERKPHEATQTQQPQHSAGRYIDQSKAELQSSVHGFFEADNQTSNNFSAPSSSKMHSVESELAKLFPTMGHTNIFDGSRKRFSNIESSSNSPYCAQLLNTQPKRYSNIETQSYEAKKRTENGQVVYDFSDSKHEFQSDGDKSITSSLQFPTMKTQHLGESEIMQPEKKSGNEEIMSAVKLDRSNFAPTTTTSRTHFNLSEQNAKSNLGENKNTTNTSTLKTEELSDITKNRQESEQTILKKDTSSTYEEFRQRAKAVAEAAAAPAPTSMPATAPPTLGEDQPDKSAFHFDHEKLFKDFDDLSKQLHMELESSKAQKEQREKSASLYDLSRMQWQYKDHFDDLKKRRHEHMKELEREIERSMRSRQLRSFVNSGKIFEDKSYNDSPRTFQIPIKVEKDNISATPHEQPPARTYEIPIEIETNTKHPMSASAAGNTSWDFSINDPARFRRAESMFNLSEHVPRPSSQQTFERHHNLDDWSRYASDLGSSENIAKPLAREVEICYQRQKPQGIRAPRLTVSTNDLSSNLHSYDNYNAYSTRRTHAPMLQQAPHRAPPQYSSCYSVLERDPNPTYISTTSRRGVSPAPPVPPSPQEPQPVVQPPPVEQRQRRASLPKEIHEQQLKYITSKEEELKMEFERLQNERRRLLDEMNRTPTLNMPQHPMRDMYRPMPKLPTLSEDEVFRQQMAEEWLNKVAEREERRLQKIIKISKVSEDNTHQSQTAHSGASKPDISQEFLNRVKERRTKLAMPADSDWESGAESQPVGPGHASESEDVPPVKVIEGRKEADLRQLPRHLREFAKLSNHQQETIDGGQRDIHHEEERRHEANNNSISSAIKKSSVVKTVKISRQPTNQVSWKPADNSSALPAGSDVTGEQDARRPREWSQARESALYQPEKYPSYVSKNSKLERRRHAQCTTSVEHPVVSGGPAGAYSSLPPTPRAKTCKKTRFSLAPERRSWSESDLLQEIDKELKLAKGFLFANGIWTPNSQTPASSLNNLNEIWPSATPPPPTPPAHPVWTPEPSPSSGRKEFRPVRFESPTLPRRYVVPQAQQSDGTTQPPWSCSYAHSQPNFAPPSPRSVRSLTNLSTPTTVGSGSTNYCDSYPSEPSINHGTFSVADKIKTFERSASTSELYAPLSRRQHDRVHPFYRPNEVIYKVKHEYMSEPETENERPRKMAQLSRRQFDGIGPVTNDGMPIVLRSEVKEPHQHEWYKRLYQTIHKQKGGDDYVIRYKCQRARPQFKSAGYQSEPEPNYDSDYATVKYRTLDRRRLQSVSSAANVKSGANSYQDDKFYGTLPNPIKAGQGAYKNQPGRIEDYVTGKSSVSEKERKEWWDEVMDIFNGRLTDHRVIPRILIEFVNDEPVPHLEQTKLSPHYTEGNLSRALAKETGYTSDSNLVFRKKEVPQSSPLSPIEQKQAYKSVQAGGEPPLFGFRKPAPERPKGLEDFEHTQITPTLAKIRILCKTLTTNLPTDCTSTSTSWKSLENKQLAREQDMFTPFPKDMASFINLDLRKKETPPQPPNRKSSCRKITNRKEADRPAIPKRHEQCFQSPGSTTSTTNKFGTITLRKHSRDPICRSKSAGAVSTLLTSVKTTTTRTEPRSAVNGDRDVKVAHLLQHSRYRSISPPRSQTRVVSLRQSSRSPVAFGRSISKERTFAEEKKRLENSLPSRCTNFEASTNILRDPSLRSPQEVKQAVRSYATCAANVRSKSLPRLRQTQGIPISSTSTTIRHSMCFPQMKLFDCVKGMNKENVRSKSPVTNAISSVSLARTNSTFSLESSPVKSKISKGARKSATSNKVPETKVFANSQSKTDRAKKEAILHYNNAGSASAGKTSLPTHKGRLETSTKVKTFISTSKAALSEEKGKREKTQICPHSQIQHLSYHKSRSLSPKRYYQSEENYVISDGKYTPSDSEPLDRSCIDNLVWQYGQREPTEGSVGYANTVVTNEKVRKFSPTREVRVPPSAHLMHATSPSTSKSLTLSANITRPLSPTASELSSRKFSPTREIRVPQTSCSIRSSSPPVCKSLISVMDIARPLSPILSDNSSRKFSPTREIRIQQTRLHRSHSPVPANESPDSETKTRRFSPTREVRVPQTARNVRSPSRRRIDSHRAQVKTDTSKIIRASSLSSADDRSKRGLYLCGELAHSATSLTDFDRHSPTCRYRNNSERFTDLNRFYSTLERVGQLERATSLTSFKPIRKDSELMDFDEWRKVRCHERAEKELNYLVCKLKQDQRNKDFIFRSKDPDEVRWRQETDFGLHSKEKSVEDLRYAFERKHFLREYDQANRCNGEPTKDYVKPYWRRNTVADLASNLEGRLFQDNAATTPASDKTRIHLSNHLVSTLSKDQITKITQQLNEIYSNNTKLSAEEYVVTVNQESKSRLKPGSSTLKVRCNSSITKEDLLQPITSRKEAFTKTPSVSHSKSAKDTDGRASAQHHELSQSKSDNTERKSRDHSPIILARETRGAIAAKNAEVTLPKTPHVPLQPDCYHAQAQNGSNRMVIDTQAGYTNSLPIEVETSSHVHYEQCDTDAGRNLLDNDVRQSRHTETKETFSAPAKEPDEKISQKIQYFEERQFEEPPKTIYHAREDSSPDEAEVMRIIEENMKRRARKNALKHKELSSSLTDLKDMFGEKNSARVNFHLHSPPQRPPDAIGIPQAPPTQNSFMEVSSTCYDLGDVSPHSSIEMFDSYYRSRSLSPDSQTSSYLQRVHTGDVRRIKEKFESFDPQTQLQQEQEQTKNKRCDFFGLSSLRKVRSDPELKRFNAGSKDTFKTLMNSEEHGDVSWIAHKFELRSRSLCDDTRRGRGRKRMAISPTPLKNRLMPHIDIISKTAALKEQLHKKQPPKKSADHSFAVERIRSQFEAAQLASPHSTSSPDVSSACEISQHLSANWIAHKYPSPQQNTHTDDDAQPNSNKAAETKVRAARVRSSSASPPRPPKSVQHRNSILKSHYEDIFANQNYNPKIHQPKARYVPDGAETNDWKKATTPHSCCTRSSEVLKGSLTTTFQDFGYVPPIPAPPTRMPDSNGNYSESPNRYLESDVNIHFKTPVRHEYKTPLSEEELALRQAEQMQKLYQEERRRKYLQELQDMHSRRHTDNFTPSQKSPIPLNRYDDFQSDLAPKSPIAATKAVARALYNFQGQNARELSFKKGDVIYIRRQIDRNWYEGEHNAMIGLLPVNYVEIINKEGARSQPRTKPSEGQARAKYNFQAQSAVEISLNKGELVTLTRRVDENWFEGKIANRKGIFPVSYVEVLTDIGAEDIAAKTVITEHSTTNLRPSLETLRTNINNEFNLITKNGHQPPNGILKETKNLNKIDALHVDTSSETIRYRALYKYRPQKADEMELLEGDIIHVLEMCSDGWFVGTNQRTGCFGTFPGNYVERI